MNRTIVSVSGYGFTGSSAVVDYLKGFENVSVADDFEFQIHYLPDGISDLDYKLNHSCCRFYDSDVAITRFLSLCKQLDRWYDSAFHGHLYEMGMEYIDSLIPVKWTGYWAWDRLHIHQGLIDKLNYDNSKAIKLNKLKRFINRFLRLIHVPRLPYLPIKSLDSIYEKRQMYMSIKPSEFENKTKQFSEDLISCLCHNSQSSVVVVNQMLPPQNPHKFQRYFSSTIKSIVTLRDPRDLYIQVSMYKWPVIPTDDVYSFIRWYRENLKYTDPESDIDVLRIYFEDLIYEYDITAKKICDFIGGINISDVKTSFNPHMSVINTQLYNRFHQYNNEIRIIETELSDYLYDFNGHKPVKCTAKEVFDEISDSVAVIDEK